MGANTFLQLVGMGKAAGKPFLAHWNWVKICFCNFSAWGKLLENRFWHIGTECTYVFATFRHGEIYWKSVFGILEMGGNTFAA